MMIDGAEKEGCCRELVLKGALVIQRVTEVREELQKALEEADILMVNLMETSEMDLSCLQLLCSAHRAAIALKKTLIRVGGPEIRGIFAGVDVTGARDCSLACDQGCVWVGGKAA
jgi:anti-anti-sigma regulatory factor